MAATITRSLIITAKCLILTLNRISLQNKKIIVIVGGPGSGKTTIIEALSENGHCCYPEISRQITLEARKRGIEQLFLEQPILFSELLLEGRKKQFEKAGTELSEVVFLDRGIPDILAYMHYSGDSYPSFFDSASRENRYDQIFLLPPWKEIYVCDDARYENFEQASLIYKHLKETYSQYSYDCIEVPKDSVEKRIEFILANIVA